MEVNRDGFVRRPVDAERVLTAGAYDRSGSEVGWWRGSVTTNKFRHVDVVKSNKARWADRTGVATATLVPRASAGIDP